MRTEGVFDELELLAEQVGVICQSHKWQLCTAESCTGGLVAAAITDIAGSSAWFSSGVVTYSNEAKQQLLGVEPIIFEQHGAVSEACVIAMAKGALHRFEADIAVSVSGIAGPGGATPGKPVGTVWIAWARRMCEASQNARSEGLAAEDLRIVARCYPCHGTRSEIRAQAVAEALRGIVEITDSPTLSI